MNRTILVGAFALVAACDQNEAREATPTREVATARPAADNTERNEREENPATDTAEDQGTSDADITITQLIRQGVIDAESLSATAKNAKIITRNGHVTLRGPVNSEEERTTLVGIARRVSGVTGVDNRLEVIVASNRTE